MLYFTGMFYAVVRQISILFTGNKDSVFCQNTQKESGWRCSCGCCASTGSGDPNFSQGTVRLKRTFNPFTVPASQMSGLKSAHATTVLQTIYFPVLVQQIYFRDCAFWWKSFYQIMNNEKGLRIPTLALLLVVFKRDCGSERLNETVQNNGNA